MNLKIEELKLNIAFGLMALFAVLIFGIIGLGSESFIFLWIKYIVLGGFLIPFGCFFLYVLTTATKFKSEQKWIIDDNFFVTKHGRDFFYNEGIRSTMWSIHAGATTFLAVKIISNYFTFLQNNIYVLVAFFVVSLAIFLLIDFIIHKILYL